MSARLPPLNPLRVFDAVARTENLTAAARELHVTQSAVSRQISVLESYLGQALFRRERHGVMLTEAGRQYAQQVLPAFAAIAKATDALVRQASHGALRVRTYTTFAAKWLIPRLPDFQRQHPGMEVRISTAVPDVDFDRDAVDIAIQFGEGDYPQAVAELMFHDEIEPVCSPQFLARHASPGRQLPVALLGQRLLVSHYRRTDWDDWLAATGHVDDASGAERMSFSSSVLTWQAAVDGLGLAIGQNALLQSEYDSGQLVRPFQQPCQRPRAYYLVRPKHQRESRKVMAFRDWIMAQC